jgi:hypothetical protein
MEAIIWLFWLTVAGIITAPFVIIKGVKALRGRKTSKSTTKTTKTAATAATSETKTEATADDIIDVEYTVVVK